MSQRLSIEFVIIGGSLTGFCSAISLARAGHKVTLFDITDPEKGTPRDGGCRVPPNATKILYRWGLEERLRACSLKSTGNVYARYAYAVHGSTLTNDSGSVVGVVHDWEEKILEETGGDFLLLHYRDLRRILAYAAKEQGVTLRFGEAVKSLHPHLERPAVTLQSGERAEADVVLGADGQIQPGFVTRMVIMEATGQEEEKTPSVMQIFHIIVPEDAMDKLDISKGIRNSGKVFTWFGHSYGAFGYPIVSFQHSRLLSSFEVLTREFHQGGRVLCLGEGAHPLPVIGDAVVLGRVFSHLHRREQISSFLQAVQTIRQARVAEVLEAAKGNIFALFIPRGSRRRTTGSCGSGPSAGLRTLESIFGYDPEDAADDWWLEWGVM
ncbi:hypothetical protein C8Q80DRAFT_1216279 [Daedaleopsis nitida]|nr:hypothetical protein C8Q80DRAFT_1216279 [Daedaleopsis nitida]